VDRHETAPESGRPLTPFAMPEYKLSARQEALDLEAEAETWAVRGRENVQRATDYVLGGVLFAAALFFAGMSTKLSTERLRIALLSVGVVVFVGTVIWIATLPVTVSV
jgi:hypothetical protein